jgi:hypothetical protein
LVKFADIVVVPSGFTTGVAKVAAPAGTEVSDPETRVKPAGMMSDTATSLTAGRPEVLPGVSVYSTVCPALTVLLAELFLLLSVGAGSTTVVVYEALIDGSAML